MQQQKIPPLTLTAGCFIIDPQAEVKVVQGKV
jgi:hypothetical protein